MSAPRTPLEALRAIMEAYNLTRGDIARILGLTPRRGGSHGTVDNWLAGRVGIPRAKLRLIHMVAPGYKRPADAPQRRTLKPAEVATSR